MRQMRRGYRHGMQSYMPLRKRVPEIHLEYSKILLLAVRYQAVLRVRRGALLMNY